MRTQASPDLCAESKWLIAFNFNSHMLRLTKAVRRGRLRSRGQSISLKRRRSQNQSEHLDLAFVRVNSLPARVIVQRFQLRLRPRPPYEMRQQLRRTGAPDRVYQTLRLDLDRRNPIRRDR